MSELDNENIEYYMLKNRKEIYITSGEMLIQFKNAGLDILELIGLDVISISYHQYENILDDKYINFNFELMDRTKFRIGYCINRNRYYVCAYRRKEDKDIEFLEHVCEGLDDTWFDSIDLKGVCKLAKAFQAYEPIEDIIRAMQVLKKSDSGCVI